MHNLIRNIVLDRVMNAVAAGTSVQNSAWVDTLGADYVEFHSWFGALTATQVTNVKLQYSVDGLTTLGDVAGSLSANLADGDSNKGIRHAIYKPTSRYVRAVVTRGTANAVIDGVFALIGVFEKPVTQNADIAVTVKSLNGPATGTA